MCKYQSCCPYEADNPDVLGASPAQVLETCARKRQRGAFSAAQEKKKSLEEKKDRMEKNDRIYAEKNRKRKK